MEDILAFVVCALLVIAITIGIIGSIGGFYWWTSAYEVKVWNKLHNSSYSQADWFFGSDSIKDYNGEGKAQTINVKGLK